MKIHQIGIKALLLCAIGGGLAMSATAQGDRDQNHPGRAKGMAVAYPFVFTKGNETSRTMVNQTVDEIATKADYSFVPDDVAKATWFADHLQMPRGNRLPSKDLLQTYGKSLNVSKVIYGSVSWDTRSIWVGTGPKTISTAKVNVFVYDVSSNSIVYRHRDVVGRSDEKENVYKDAADLLLTPLVTIVSGGPATPHEQRAVQIALGRAFRAWPEINAPSH